MTSGLTGWPTGIMMLQASPSRKPAVIKHMRVQGSPPPAEKTQV
jgi:hypothetical protein